MNKKSTTARELSEHFEVSQRTIYRDIDTLCQAGIPIYTNKGKGGGIALMENFILNKSVLSEQEQNDILSALQGFKATSYSDTNQVLSKLNSLFGNKNTDWIEVDFSFWNSMEEDKIKFNLLKESILNRNVIQFDYYNSYGQEAHRVTEPRKLIFKGQSWYLLAYCRDKKDFRYFKITRLKELQVESEIFSDTPLPAAKKDKSASGVTQPMVDVKLKVDADMAYRIYDEFPMEAIVKNEDGSFLIHAKLQTGGWLYGYLMSFEDHVEILKPSTLRDEIINKYKSALKIYEI
ncbi:MAG: transcriptional regulator DeoR family [Herbinix sp.]|jgi:predicted DNA-binding transcriptional regulator YafY|nr:transcriptional regulator DeoR family [Herbinix sp.]